MSTYYFHLRDSIDHILDPEGIQCPSLEDVRVKALKCARDLIAGDAITGAIDLTYRIDVEDADGAVVHTIRFEDAVTIKRH
jgi:hypothetical protein